MEELGKTDWGEIRNEVEVDLKIVMRIWEGWWWVLGRRFPLFPEEILTKQGNVFIGLPLLVSAVSD